MMQSENLSLNTDPSFMSGEPLGKSLGSEACHSDELKIPDPKVVVGPEALCAQE